MKQYLSVLKLLIKNNYFPTRRRGEKRDGGKVATMLAFGLIYVVFAPVLVAMVFFMAQTATAYYFVEPLVAMLFGISGLVVLFFGIVAILSYLYFSKDTEFFLSLPVKPSAIFFAKFTIIYIQELVLSAAILLPTLITIGVVVGASWFFYLLIPVGILLVPALPLMLASLISIPLMYVVSFFKNKGAWTSVVILILAGAAFAVYFYVIQLMSNPETFENIEYTIAAMASSITTLGYVLFPYLAFARAGMLTRVWGLGGEASAAVNLTIFVASVAVLFVATGLITNLVYKKSAASQIEGKKAVSRGDEKFAASGVRGALIKKEWREVIRQPAFAYQCLSPVILTPVFIAIMGFLGNLSFEVSEYFSEHLATQAAWFGLFLMIGMMGISTNVGAMTSITREGKAFHMAKLIPAPYKTQAQAKVFVNLSISLVASLLGLIVISFFVFDIINLLFGIIVCAAFSYAFTCLAVYNDLKKPKLDWATPNQAVKQNWAMLVPMLLGMLASLVFFGISFLAIFLMPNMLVAQFMIWGILIAVTVTLAVCMHLLLYKNVDWLYNRISV